jgi:predicted AlkP superfamily phosphohydrolase/phosphomutase
LNIGDIDFAGTTAYAALDHREVWVNLSGRQPQGIVAADDYETVCDRIADALLEWRVATTGLQRVRAVHRHPDAGADLVDGIAPDLLIDWDPAAAPAGANPDMTGDHAPEGTLIVAGPGIRPGRLADCALTDVAPIVLGALGVRMPASMDGRLPADLAAGLEA